MSELSDGELLNQPMSAPIESLTAHASWVRSLARSLVGDAHLAEDLVQDTYVAAMQRPPRANGNVRAWLSTVLRNLVRESHRKERRRSSHETEFGRRTDSSPPDLVEKVLTDKGIVEAVLGLAEPYRTAVLMRYYEDLPPRKIAAQLGVPVSTVHTRITRGVEALRKQLDRDHGGREAWLMALVPSLHSTATPLPPLVGAAIMNSKLYVTAAAAAALLIVGSVVFWPEDDSPKPQPQAEKTTGATAEVVAEPEGSPSSEAPAEVEARELLGDEKKPKPTPTAAEGIVVTGRLVDANALPLVGRKIGFFDEGFGDEACESESETQGRGAFELSIPNARGTLRIHEPGWRTVLASVVDATRAEPALIVAAPKIDLAGRVVDEFGKAISGVRLQIKLPESFRSRFDEISDFAAVTFLVHHSAPDGQFTIAEACFVKGAHLTVVKPGFEPISMPLPEAGHSAIELTLPRVKRVEGTISGQVVDEFGRVVSDAWVTLGLSHTKSDERGAFTLRIPDRGPSDVLFAIRKGALPARLQKPSDDSGWPADVELRLGGEPLSIGGRVVDGDGKPVSGARVWVFDGTFAGRVDRTASTLQGLMLGAPTRTAMANLIRESGANPREMMRSTSTALWPFVRSSKDGSFRVEGLVDRDYVLRAMVEDTLLMVDLAKVRAGRTDVELRFPVDAYYPKLSGRVVSRRGRPIENAEIRTQCDPAVVRLGRGASTQHRTAQSGRTDKDGVFTFERVPRNLVYIRVDGDGIVPIEFGRRVEGGLQALVGQNTSNLVIEVDVRVHIKVVLDEAGRADSFAMLDADGKKLTINRFEGHGRSELKHQPLHDGKSGVVVVPEASTRIALYKGKKLIDESVVDLIIGEVNEIRR